MAVGMSKKKRMGYMGGGMMMNSMKKKPPMSKMFRGGGMTSDATPSYKDMVQKMYGGGMTKKKLNYEGGGITKTKLSEKELKGLQNAGVSKTEIDAMRGKNLPTVTTVGKRRVATDPLIATNKRRKRTKKLQAELDKNPRNSITLGTKRAARPLDGERSRGRKYDRSNAGTKFSDSKKDVKNVI